MCYALTVLTLSAALVAASAQAGELKRYIYCAQPDGSTSGGPGNKNGILVLDIDQKFSFVKRFTTPGILAVRQGVSGGCGMRGIAVCRQTGRLYYDWHQGNKPGDDGAGCLDLKTGKVVWERKYDFTCERPQVSCDGKTVFIPRHWTDTKTHRLYCLDAATGEPGRVYDTGKAWPQHPLVVHPDGKRLFFPGACLDLESGNLLWTEAKVSRGQVHIVLDHTGTRLYTGRHPENETVATWVLDANTGAVAAKALIDKAKYPELKGISEVVAFEPGGGHFWGEARKYMVRFDNTKDPPELVNIVNRDDLNAAHGLKLSDPKGHAMVTGAGDYVWFSNGAVLEAQSGKFVCVMTAEDGRFTRGAKFLEVDFLDGEIIWTGQDESHGFIYNDYPIDRVRPLLPPSSPIANQSPRLREANP
jgi:hypothetical protein